METQVRFVVVGHHTRFASAALLAGELGAHLLLDEGNHGANWNHRRALEWAAEQSCRVVVLEDDALPVPGFADKAADWLARFPDDMLSFYLGTGRPPQYQKEIAGMLVDADRVCGDHIVMSKLIHGVCYSPPPGRLASMLNSWNKTLAADYAVGEAYGCRVIYPCYSLVDHADLPTVERHPDNEPRTERRRAWRLA
ncbi:Glycosyltransferase [Leclercia sp. M-A074-M]